MDAETSNSASAQLCVPEDFAVWVKTLPQSVRRKLSIHDLRQVWEGSVREAYRFARPWLDAKGVYHRHDGVDFPSSDACPYCQIQAVVDERDSERTWREELLSETVPNLERRVRDRDARIRDLEAENQRLREAGSNLLNVLEEYTYASFGDAEDRMREALEET